MDVLVTGGCGFIGSHLVEALLARGDRVRILDDLSSGRRENVCADCEIRVGDVADPATVAQAMAGMDACVHLAAVASVQRCHDDWLSTHRVNQSGLVAVLEATRRLGRPGVPVVYASSAAVYGDNDRLPLDEDEPPRPISAYGCDKLGCEQQARIAGLVHGVPTLGLRFFNVYGSRQNPASPYSGVISIFAGQALRGEPLTVHGDGGQIRDFVHVEDVVRALLAGLGHASAAAPVFNVCTGRPTTIGGLARSIRALTGGSAPVIFAAPRAGDIRASVGATERAAAGIGFQAAVAVADGLARTLDTLFSKQK